MKNKSKKEPIFDEEREDTRILKLTIFVFMPITGIVMGLLFGLLLNM